MLTTFISYVLIFFLTIFWGLIGLVLALFSNRLSVKYVIRPWGISMLWACRIKLKVEGVENIPEERSIIMYNHQSSFDILAFCAALPIEWKAIMKKEVSVIPFIGWIARLSGHYFVARDGSRGDTKEVKRIVSRIKTGPSVIMSPEGTRSEDGRLLPFKKGGFLIAMLSGVPVVPMVIWGGMNVAKKDRFKLESNKEMLVKILEPIEVDRLPGGRKGREELEQMVRTKMEEVINGQLELENRDQG